MSAARPIRVLHVGKFYSPEEGGIENVVQELVNSFRDDAEVDASVLVAQRKGRATEDIVERVTVRRVRSHGVLLGLPLAPRFAVETAREARRFDLVHVHVPNPLPFLCDWRSLARRGTRLIVHHHSDIVRPAQRLFLRGLRGPERRFYEAASRVLVTSRGLLTSSETLAPYQRKCSVLPLSISLDRCRRVTDERRATVRAELGCGDGDVVFFFLGRLVYYKGVADLLRAAAGCGPCKVWIGGAGPLRAELEALCSELGLAGRVRFLGKIPQEQLPEIFSAADVFCLPSNEASEAFGVVQLEAMAYGLPVINTSLPTGVPEVSLHGETGLTVPPHDPGALSAAMRRLAADPALQAQFGAAALRRVERFARPAITEKLRSLYREVMEEPIRGVSASQRWRALPGGRVLRPGSQGDAPSCSARSWSIFPQR